VTPYFIGRDTPAGYTFIYYDTTSRSFSGPLFPQRVPVQ
jgi:hypothetical protein